jgi:hypothetical protein
LFGSMPVLCREQKNNFFINCPNVAIFLKFRRDHHLKDFIQSLLALKSYYVYRLSCSYHEMRIACYTALRGRIVKDRNLSFSISERQVNYGFVIKGLACCPCYLQSKSSRLHFDDRFRLQSSQEFWYN